MLPLGLALVILAGEFATLTDTTAELAAPLAAGLAIAGLLLGPIRRSRPDLWALGTAIAVFAVFAAPVVLSGEATFAGYIKLDDTATYFAMTDRVMEHARDLAGPRAVDVRGDAGDDARGRLPDGRPDADRDRARPRRLRPRLDLPAVHRVPRRDARALAVRAARAARPAAADASIRRLRRGAAGDPVRLLALGRDQGARRSLALRAARGARALDARAALVRSSRPAARSRVRGDRLRAEPARGRVALPCGGDRGGASCVRRPVRSIPVKLGVFAAGVVVLAVPAIVAAIDWLPEGVVVPGGVRAREPRSGR